MSYVNPKIKKQFESLSIGLQDAILSSNVRLENMQDLINALNAFVKDEEGN